MPTIAIIYHSGYGHTRHQAEAVARGAQSVPGASVRVMTVDSIDWAYLLSADAHIYGSPTYMGSVSGPFKTFMDQTGQAWMKREWKDKLAAGFTNSGGLSGDKLNTLVQLAIFAAQHGMLWVGQSEMPAGSTPEAVNRISSFLGAMAQSERSMGRPSDGDLQAAELLGARVAAAAARWGRSGASGPI